MKNTPRGAPPSRPQAAAAASSGMDPRGSFPPVRPTVFRRTARAVTGGGVRFPSEDLPRPSRAPGHGPILALLSWSASAASWYGVLRDGAGHPLAQAIVALRQEFQTATDARDKSHFDDLADGSYSVTVLWIGRSAMLVTDISGERFEASLELSDSNVLSLHAATEHSLDHSCTATLISG